MRFDYDYIIVGLGAAGMSLAYYLSQTALMAHKKVLILEKSPKTENDRTWAFWGTPPAPIDQFIQKTWHSIFLKDGNTTAKVDARAMPYHYLPARAFYQGLLPPIQAHPNITWLQAPATAISADDQAAYVTANGATFATQYVFNSGYPFTSSLMAVQDEICYQRFRGWEVVFDEPVIDDTSATLMDFISTPSTDLRFLYSLHLSSHRLIINCTAFGQAAPADGYYEQQMGKYLRSRFKGGNYQIDRKEGGMIPMSHRPLQRFWGERVVNMGILGGDTRPSTGYTFMQAVTFARELAQALSYQQPFPKGQWGRCQQFYDKLFLHVLQDDPSSLKQSLMQIFRHNKAPTIFRFMDGSSTSWEELALVMTLPFSPFLRALWKQWQPKTQPHASPFLPAKG